MEEPASEDAANFDSDEARIGDNLYAQPVNDEKTDTETALTTNESSKRPFEETRSPQLRDLSTFENIESRFDDGYDSDLLDGVPNAHGVAEGM